MKFITPSQYSLDYIADRLALQDLCTKYAVGVDRKDWEYFRECFTDDAMIDYTPTGGIKGTRDEVIEWLSQSMTPFRGSQHFTLNAEVNIDGDTADGRIGFYNPMPIDLALIGQGEGIKMWIVGGWYVDKYRRTEEGWKFSYRTEERSYDTTSYPFFKAYGADEPGFVAPPTE